MRCACADGAEMTLKKATAAAKAAVLVLRMELGIMIPFQNRDPQCGRDP